MEDTISILVIPTTSKGLLVIYACQQGWWNFEGTQCCLTLHLFFFPFIKLMLVFRVVICTNYIPSLPKLSLLLASIQWDRSRAWESGRQVKKGGPTLADTMNYQPRNGALGRGERGKRHQKDKGKDVDPSFSRTEWQRTMQKRTARRENARQVTMRQVTTWQGITRQGTVWKMGRFFFFFENLHAMVKAYCEETPTHVK